jgi:hypothetical protein
VIPPIDEAKFREAVAQIYELRRRILARRGGVPVEVDDILDELRGRADRDPR